MHRRHCQICRKHTYIVRNKHRTKQKCCGTKLLTYDKLRAVFRAGLALLTAAARAAPNAPLPGSILPLRETTGSILPRIRLSAPSSPALELCEGSASLDAAERGTAQAAAILLLLHWCASMCAESGAMLGPASPVRMYTCEYTRGCRPWCSACRWNASAATQMCYCAC